MILIADSGSTKCDWVVVDRNENVILKVRTEGLNPRLLSIAQICEILCRSKKLFEVKESINKVFFYGAGCADSQSRSNLMKMFSDYFSNAIITIEEDLTAAVHATTEKPGIICIMGTGSNSCYFDGTEIDRRLVSLGFILMDDGSGNYYGKELLRAYFYGKMTEHLQGKFSKAFNIKEEVVLENIYKKQNVSQYLAQYAQFIIENRYDPFIREMIRKGIYKFFENLVSPYHKELETVPLHFVGSIAYFLQEDILLEATKRGYRVDSFVRAPIDNLVNRLSVNGAII